MLFGPSLGSNEILQEQEEMEDSKVAESDVLDPWGSPVRGSSQTAHEPSASGVESPPTVAQGAWTAPLSDSAGIFARACGIDMARI